MPKGSKENKEYEILRQEIMFSLSQHQNFRNMTKNTKCR